MKKNNLTIAIAIAVPIIVIACVLIINNMNDQGGDNPGPSTIEIVDGSGAKITLDAPIDSCILVNTQVAQAICVLGEQDRVEDILFYKAKKVDAYREMGFDIPDDSPVFSNLDNAEWIRETGVKYIIEPAGSSSKLKDTVESECKSYGITIIKLDCYGETMLEDMQKVIKIFGSTDKSQQRFDEYLSTYNDVVNAVKSKATAKDLTFLVYMNGLKALYNEKSEMSILFSSVVGKNGLEGLGLPTTGVTNKIDKDNILEKLTELDAEVGIDLLVIRGTADPTETEIKGYWNGTDINKFQFEYMGDEEGSNVYFFDSDIMSGPMDYMCYAAIGDVLGLDYGYSLSGLVSDYNQKYHTDKKTDGLVYQYVFDSEGMCESLIDMTS